ncbi:MAG: hypothetical protein H6Q44_2377 [Deltaproteobacteria bacterium]|nr:hypothetical protein [Deltaproteobacteria bacterium]
MRKVSPIIPLDHIAGSQQESRLFRPQVLCPAGKMGHAPQELSGAERLIGFGEAVKIIHMENSQIERLGMDGD